MWHSRSDQRPVLQLVTTNPLLEKDLSKPGNTARNLHEAVNRNRRSQAGLFDILALQVANMVSKTPALVGSLWLLSYLCTLGFFSAGRSIFCDVTSWYFAALVLLRFVTDRRDGK